MIGFCSLLAYKRNENLDLWEGLFYDYDLVFANLKEKKQNSEILEEKEDIFKKETLFEGLLESSFDSRCESQDDKNKEKKEEMYNELVAIEKSELFGDEENIEREESQVKSKIKAFEEMKFVPGMSLQGKEELNKLLKKNQH